MNPGLTIALSVLIGLTILIAILGLVFSRTRRKLDRLVAEKFDRREILGATIRANFFGVKSKGGAQIRGNGALVLTGDEIHFIRAVPLMEFSIPKSSIRKVSTPRSFNGKSVLVPLLCVSYDTEAGEDSVAWALPNTMQWKDAIERWLQHRGQGETVQP